MVVGLLGNRSPDSNRLILVTPKSENDVRLQAKLGNQNPTGLPVGVVSEQLRQDHIPYITATHDIHNPRSGQVMKRLGMKYQYSYEEQWLPKNILVTFRMYQLNLDGHDERVYQKYWELSDVHYVENEALF